MAPPPVAKPDPAIEVEKLRKRLANAEEELSAAQATTVMMQDQIRKAYEECDADIEKKANQVREELEEAAEKVQKKLQDRIAELEEKLDDAAKGLEDLDEQNDRLKQEKDQAKAKLADALHRAELLQKQLDTARDVADSGGQDLVLEQQRAAQLELELDRLKKAGEEASGAWAAEKAALVKSLSDTDAEMDKLKGELAQANEAAELKTVAEEYEKGSRRPPGSKDSVLAAQQVHVLNEQLAAKERQLTAKDRQLTALKAEREELSARAEEAERRGRPAGPSEEMMDRVDLAERTVAALKRERDELMARLQEGSTVGKVAGKSIAEKLAEERADQAETAADTLRKERTELRKKVDELEARLAPAAADAARKMDARVSEAERRADVSERQLTAIKAEREELRRKLDEVASGGLAVVSTEPAVRNGALTQVRDELIAVQAEVASVIGKLRDREKVLSKVLARSHVGEMSRLTG